MGAGVQGWHRDLWIAADGSVVRETAAARNRVVHRALDLIGDLLVRRPGRRGLLWFAMGAGDASWDANLPTPSETATALRRELFRVPLDAGNFTIDPAQRSITLRVSVPQALITETLREFGVFGGDATALPNTGYLFSYRIHPAVRPPDTPALLRELTLQFHVPTLSNDGWLAVAELLANQPGAAGIGFWAEGSGDPAWDAAPPAADAKIIALRAEVFRTALPAPLHLFYDARSHAVVASVDLEMDEAAAPLRETGLFTGADQPKLLAYRTYAVLDKRQPQRLHREFRVELAGDTTVKVPDIAGLALADAQTALTSADLVADPISQRDDAANTGKVVEFSPAAGARVPSGSRVAVTVGATPRVVVPNLLGLQPGDAATVLTRRGLRVSDGGQDIVPEDGIPGSVLRQSPAPGLLAAQGSAVVLTLGIPRTVTIPDLSDLIPDQALLKLQAADLKLAAAPYPTAESDAETGTVVAQNPAANTPAPRWSEVQITLAAIRTLEVPDLAGKTVTDAEQLVKAASDAAAKALGREAPIPWLSLGERAEEDSEVSAGTIIRQTPAAQARAPLYTALRIVVSQPAPVIVPDITGILKDAAVSKLQQVRLRLGDTSTQPSALLAGTVLSQEPLAGIVVPAGSGVDAVLATPILVAVPALVGLSVGAGGELVKAAGLIYGTPVPGPGTQPEGMIIGQNPAAGSMASLGSTVIPTAVVRVTVPNVVGLKNADASSQLRAAGFSVSTTLQRSPQPVGSVVAQAPTAGTRASASSTVAITIAQGQVVPNLIGTPSTNLSNLMGSLGLRFEVTTRASDQPVGIILEQSVPANTEVPLQTLVRVVAAAGIAVPNVLNLDPDAAKAALVAAGLQLRLATRGNIVALQDPAAGQVVPLNSTVTLTLRTLTGITVPDVTRKSSDAAIAALQAAGLQGEVASRLISTDPAGTVVKQDPAAGTVADRGTVVKLTVSAGIIRFPIG